MHCLAHITLASSLVILFVFHRLFHHPRVYKHVHKIHHEITEPFGLTSTYCHPVEHFFVNLLPVTIGPIIIGAHISLTFVWFAIAITSSTNDHSGYHLPFLPSPEAHDYHHFK